MIKKEITVGRVSRLNASPAALLVQAASKFGAGIFVEHQDKMINAKSIMGVMTLRLADGEIMTVSADGEDEKEAIEEVCRLLSGK